MFWDLYTPRARSAGLAALCAALLVTGGPARAQDLSPTAAILLAQTDDNPFSALVGRRREASPESARLQPVERYVLTSDGRSFLFEERGTSARVQFLCSPEDMRIDCVLDGSAAPEIYLLSATRAPRGDVIYKNDEGETLLRIAAYGGATVFWPGEMQGAAASKSFGDDHALTLDARSYDDALRRAQSASAQVSAIVGTTILFDVGAGRRSSQVDASVLADAVLTAAKGIVTVADDPIGASVIAERVSRVAFLPGAQPGVALNGSVLEILYVPKQDIKGRPSSAKVAHYLEDTL
jgi:hypothetical protein